MHSQSSKTVDHRRRGERAQGPAAGEWPAPFDYRFSPSPAAVQIVRRALGQWLASHHRVNVDSVDDLLIACSELCTNAMRSASDTESSVAVRAWSENKAVIIEVEDGGGGFAWPVEHGLQDVPDDDEHGRGLFIVAAITDEMQVKVEPRRTVVRCAKRDVLDHAAPARDRELSANYRSEAPPGQPNH
ncbi:MAG: ATP-binding protein [Actinobacteria bacterium]|nr:ATP-binding protein [Actinomycetota bacterium]